MYLSTPGSTTPCWNSRLVRVPAFGLRSSLTLIHPSPPSQSRRSSSLPTSISRSASCVSATSVSPSVLVSNETDMWLSQAELDPERTDRRTQCTDLYSLCREPSPPRLRNCAYLAVEEGEREVEEDLGGCRVCGKHPSSFSRFYLSIHPLQSIPHMAWFNCAVLTHT